MQFFSLFFSWKKFEKISIECFFFFLFYTLGNTELIHQLTFFGLRRVKYVCISLCSVSILPLSDCPTFISRKRREKHTTELHTNYKRKKKKKTLWRFFLQENCERDKQSKESRRPFSFLHAKQQPNVKQRNNIFWYDPTRQIQQNLNNCSNVLKKKYSFAPTDT